MSLKRKLLAGGAAAVLVAGGAAGAGLAASGHGRSAPPTHLHLANTSRAAFLSATAQYLGTDTAALQRGEKAGQTLAQIAAATPGRSERQLAALLVTAATAKLRQVSDRAMPIAQQGALHRMLRQRIAGFLNDTCALGLAAFAKHLAGCPGMT